MATIPNNSKPLTYKHYQMVILTTEKPIILNTSLMIREDDPSILDNNLVLPILQKYFLIELKYEALKEQIYITHVQAISSIDNIPELIKYNEDTLFGYIIQDITDPTEPKTLSYHSIKRDE